MKNKLFWICPASKVEHFIQEKYGENSFFITGLGAVFKLKELAYVEELISFIESEAIEELIVVNDTSCCFIHNVLTRQKGYGTHAEQVLLNLLLDHYAYVTGCTSVAEQKARLAALNVQRQIDELLGHYYFLQQVVLQKLVVKGLVTSRAAGKARAVNLRSEAFSI
jgi:carbonic anhydrase